MNLLLMCTKRKPFSTRNAHRLDDEDPVLYRTNFGCRRLGPRLFAYKRQSSWTSIGAPRLVTRGEITPAPGRRRPPRFGNLFKFCYTKFHENAPSPKPKGIKLITATLSQKIETVINKNKNTQYISPIHRAPAAKCAYRHSRTMRKA